MNLEQIFSALGWEPQESQFSEGVGQLFDGCGTIYSVAKREGLKFLAKTPVEDQAYTINAMVRANADILFAAFALFNLYQQALFFLAGAGCGFIMSGAAKNFGLISKNVALITNAQEKTENLYMQAAIYLITRTWLTSFAGGFVVGNYLGTPTQKEGWAIPFTNIRFAPN